MASLGLQSILARFLDRTRVIIEDTAGRRAAFVLPEPRRPDAQGDFKR
ncbi:hypothetical protein LY632_12575 [Erythrobacter sp. SDW2]|nr:hypothetical protein [Erythrobacter sp. SDW2]UIP06509.1 hypothetical protein LY632_12575 [Erythrobacter sp. SDW2]